MPDYIISRSSLENMQELSKALDRTFFAVKRFTVFSFQEKLNVNTRMNKM